MNVIAHAAILRSISHNEIVHLDTLDMGCADAHATIEHLEAACDDSAENDGVIEFWGTHEDGGEWRVHVNGPTYWSDDAGQRTPMAARTKRQAAREVECSSEWSSDVVWIHGPGETFAVEVAS